MRTDVSAELLSQSPHQDQRLVHCWAYSVQFQRLSARPGRNYISFDGRFQVECPAAYKASPNMETGNCPALGLRSKHLFFPVGDHGRSLHISSSRKVGCQNLIGDVISRECNSRKALVTVTQCEFGHSNHSRSEFSTKFQTLKLCRLL